jgi:hypothetical protein
LGYNTERLFFAGAPFPQILLPEYTEEGDDTQVLCVIEEFMIKHTNITYFIYNDTIPMACDSDFVDTGKVRNNTSVR